MSAMKRGTCCIATSPTSISRLNVLWRFTKSKARRIKEPGARLSLVDRAGFGMDRHAIPKNINTNERKIMSYNIFTQDRDGLHLIKEGATYLETEIYRANCSNVVVKDADWQADVTQSSIFGDVANRLPEDLERVEPSDYGVTDERVMESATIVFACLALVPVLILAAYLTQ